VNTRTLALAPADLARPSPYPSHLIPVWLQRASNRTGKQRPGDYRCCVFGIETRASATRPKLRLISGGLCAPKLAQQALGHFSESFDKVVATFPGDERLHSGLASWQSFLGRRMQTDVPARDDFVAGLRTPAQWAVPGPTSRKQGIIPPPRRARLPAARPAQPSGA
jgi:hypothetical protein